MQQLGDKLVHFDAALSREKNNLWTWQGRQDSGIRL
jgi:hypothetical protein